MPTFSHFYSATEVEAAAGLFNIFPQHPEGSPPFTSRDAEQLTLILNGTKSSAPRQRNDISQPMFRTRPSVPAVEQLLKVSGFSIATETVYRAKPDYTGSPEDLHEWAIRSHTPSSDELSPQKSHIPSPAQSISMEAVSRINDGAENGLVHVIENTPLKQLDSWETHTEFHATYQHNVLQTMDTQFSKWSYDLNEGTTAVPFVMAHAPIETHDRLVEIDRRLWATNFEGAAEDSVNSQASAEAPLGCVQNECIQRSGSSELTEAGRNSSPIEPSAPFPDNITSKRAAIIAKSKATKDSSLVASRSVGQRRSALYKNKSRRSVMSSPPLIAKKPESAHEAESQAEKPKATVLLLNPKEEGQRRDVDSALQSGGIDFGNRQYLEVLMERLGKVSDNVSTGGREKEAEETTLDQDDHEQVGRLKGKARTKAKRRAAL